MYLLNILLLVTGTINVYVGAQTISKLFSSVALKVKDKAIMLYLCNHGNCVATV